MSQLEHSKIFIILRSESDKLENIHVKRATLFVIERFESEQTECIACRLTQQVLLTGTFGNGTVHMLWDWNSIYECEKKYKPSGNRRKGMCIFLPLLFNGVGRR